ncbi:MAG: HAMP domain-containing protein [Campylobacterales bacterium]|nr:HAMP domain-containing protein [Campylobacterales bacterium]
MSFKLKTILLILSVSLIPYTIMMVIIGHSLKKEYKTNTLTEMQTQLKLNVEKIEQYLDTIHRDMRFMSRMDVMDDIYSKDVDKRILNLLEERKNGLDMDGNFYVFDKTNNLIASSNPTSDVDKKTIKNFISMDIVSKYMGEKSGTLTLDFPLKTFTKFLSNTKNRTYYLVINKNEILYQTKKFKNPLQVSMKLKNHDIQIVLQEDNLVLENILNQYEKWFYITLFLGALFISIISLFFTNRLIKPVIELSKAADNITKKQDYSYQINVTSNDEIGTLSRSFNTMIKSMATALEKLKDESENKIKLMHEQSKNEMLQELSKNLSKYLSPQIYDSIFSGKQNATLSSKRKKLTVFFSDIVDFTDTTDTMESEDLSELLNDYLNDMTNIALSYGATVDKYIGDAVMLFFGDPESKGVKEDAINCVKMAIEMQQHMDKLHKRWIDKGFTKPFKIRIGIHTGYCTVGNFGSENRLEYTIIGSTVNLASRIESAADAGEICISEETQFLVQEKFKTDEKMEIVPKGFKRSIKLFSVNKENMNNDKIVVNENGLSLIYEPSIQDEESKIKIKKLLREFIEKEV